MAVVMVLCCIPVNALTDVTSVAKKDTLKILAIGNSFSEDATEYIPMIARDCGVKSIIVGNMYIGGCTIETHAANARENKGAYKYYKNTSFSLMSTCPTTKDVTLETALKDEEWDVITLQNSSPQSGLMAKYNSDLDYLVDYVKGFCPNAKLGWHMTWAYQNGYSSSSFKKNYNSDQMKMYTMITAAVKSKIVPNENFDFIIPSGTAIQNARTGYLGDTLTRDGLHLSLDMGRYIVGVTWMKALGFDTSKLRTMPSRVKTKVLPFVCECADNALENPFEITQSVYTYEPGKNPPATQPETVAATEPVTEAESVLETLAETKAEVTEKVETKPGKDNTAVFIIVGVIAVIAVAAIVCVVALRKKKN